MGSDDNDKENNPICGTVTSEMVANEIEVLCSVPRLGKYISIHLPGQQFLQLCEVKAYAGKCEAGKINNQVRMHKTS